MADDDAGHRFLPPSLKYNEAPFDVVQKRKEVVLENLMAAASLSKAASAAGISTFVLGKMRRDDPNFDQECIEALEMGTDALEDTAIQRARDGVDKPVFYQGAVVGSVTEYSDSLLMFMLKARRPEKYAERHRNTIEATDGSPVTFTFKTDGATAPALRQPDATDASFTEVRSAADSDS